MQIIGTYDGMDVLLVSKGERLALENAVKAINLFFGGATTQPGPDVGQKVAVRVREKAAKKRRPASAGSGDTPRGRIPLRRTMLAILKDSQRPMRCAELAEALSKRLGLQITTERTAQTACNCGQAIRRVEKGVYALAG